ILHITDVGKELTEGDAISFETGQKFVDFSLSVTGDLRIPFLINRQIAEETSGRSGLVDVLVKLLHEEDCKNILPNDVESCFPEPTLCRGVCRCGPEANVQSDTRTL